IYKAIFIYNHPLILFTNPATTQIYTLSLHDALPISRRRPSDITHIDKEFAQAAARGQPHTGIPGAVPLHQAMQIREELIEAEQRSEEHTSELQSRENLVCRLLLEKKNKNHNKRPNLT